MIFVGSTTEQFFVIKVCTILLQTSPSTIKLLVETLSTCRAPRKFPLLNLALEGRCRFAAGNIQLPRFQQTLAEDQTERFELCESLPERSTTGKNLCLGIHVLSRVSLSANTRLKQLKTCLQSVYNIHLRILVGNLPPFHHAKPDSKTSV